MSPDRDLPSRKSNRRDGPLPHRLLGELWMTVLLGTLAWLGASRGAIFLVPPFGATLAILLYCPDAEIAKPRSVVCGSVAGAAIGTALAALLGADAAAAVAAALIAAIALTAFRVFHPPGVALAMYPAVMRPGWWFPLEAVLPFTLVAIASAPWVRRMALAGSAAKRR